ncbi:hypothetical protein Tco_1411222 [Tanacetum coccineum]
MKAPLGCCLNNSKYLGNTKDMFLVYEEIPDTELDVTGFYDASWQCDKDDTKSQTGYVFIVNGGAVDWKAKSIQPLPMHATQSEVHGCVKLANGTVRIRSFGDLSPDIFFFLRRSLVENQVESGEIKLKVHHRKNLADAFTNALPRERLMNMPNGIGTSIS